VVRDLLVLSVDSSRITDPEIAGEGERDRLLGLVARFSREDLLRAFDLLARAEQEIRSAAQPRYSFEMTLLRWIHLRKLVPIEDLIAGKATPLTAAAVSPPRPASAAASKPAPAVPTKSVTAATPPASPASPSGTPFKDAFLAEIRKSKVAFYNMVVAQARTIEVGSDRVVFTFSASQRALKEQVEQNKAWLESIALQAGGRKVTVTATQDASNSPQSPVASHQSSPEPRAASPESRAASPEPRAASPEARGASPEARGASPESRASSPESDRKAALKQQALADSAVQAMLEVFPAEIRDVEEM
jgi:DNA polymerase-3 subunit gamma/tau